jgi:hypothetical protein
MKNKMKVAVSMSLLLFFINCSESFALRFYGEKYVNGSLVYAGCTGDGGNCLPDLVICEQ